MILVQSGYQRVLEADEFQVLRTQQQQQQEIVQQREGMTNEERYVQVYEGMTIPNRQVVDRVYSGIPSNTVHGVPADIYEKMPRNVQQIYEQQDYLKTLRQQDLFNTYMRQQSWRTDTITGNIISPPSQYLAEKYKPAFIPDEIFHVHDIPRPLPNVAAGVVGSVESIVRPYIPNPVAALMEPLIPRYKEEDGKVVRDYSETWNTKQVKELGIGYSVGFVAGEIAQAYIMGKVTGWGLGKLGELADVGRLDFLSLDKPANPSFDFYKVFELPDTAWKEAEEKLGYQEWREEFGPPQGVINNSFSESHLVNRYVGFDNKEWSSSFNKTLGLGFVQELEQDVKPLNPFSDFYANPEIYSEKLYGVSFKDLVFSLPSDSLLFAGAEIIRVLPGVYSNPSVSTRTVQYPDFKVSQLVSQVSGIVQIQDQKSVQGSVSLEKSMSMINQQQKFNQFMGFNEDIQQKFNQSFIQGSAQKSMQQQKQMLNQLTSQKGIQDVARPSRQKRDFKFPRQTDFFKMRKRNSFFGGWFGRKWPSAVDPEKLFGFGASRRRRSSRKAKGRRRR